MQVKTLMLVLVSGSALGSGAVSLIPSLAFAEASAAMSQSQSSANAPIATSAAADPAATNPTPASGAPAGLTEVVVTAQRRSENLQKVPLSVQALTADVLQRGGVEDVSRIELVTPGVTFAYGGNDQKINIRGANANNTYEDASPIVGVFVDGVYAARASEQSMSFFDVSQVEVLKGPQGTLYGRNTLAGAININTNVPDLRADSASIVSSYSTFNDFRNEVVVNAPVTDTFGVRLAALSETSDGYIKNNDGPNLAAKDNLAFRGSAFWRINNNVDATLRISDFRETGTPPGLFAVSGACRNVDANGLTDVLGTTLDCQNPRRGAGGTPGFNTRGRLDVSVDFAPKEDLNDFNTTLIVNANLGFARLKSTTSYTDYNSLLGQDSDFSPNPFEREWFEEDAKSYTQELTLSNPSSSRLEYTGGLYFSRDEEYFADTKLFETNDVDNATTRPLATSTNGKTLSVLNGTPLASSAICIDCLTVGDGAGKSFQYLNVNTYGAFIQATYPITDKLRITGGVRYSLEDKDTTFNPVNAPYVGPVSPSVVPTTPSNFPTAGVATDYYSKDFDRFTYRASAAYDVTRQIMTYFTFSTGFLSGALNNNTTTPSTGEQGSTSYEGGVKSRFFSNRVQLDADIYHTDYTNLVTSELVNGLTYSINGGAINVNGAELLLDVRPIDPLRITIGLSYVDSTYGQFGAQNRQQVLNGAVLSPNIIEEQGDTPPFAPKWTGNLGASYEFQLGEAGTLTPQVQFFFTSSYSASGGVVFDPAAFQPGYTKTDLRLVYASADHRYGVEAYVENLENNIINQRTQEGTDGIEQVSWGMPRVVGVRFRYKM